MSAADSHTKTVDYSHEPHIDTVSPGTHQGNGHRRKEDLRDVRTMPAQKPGQSKQDYTTPKAFMEAISIRFGRPTLDLAATGENTRCESWITPELDAFQLDWDVFTKPIPHDVSTRVHEVAGRYFHQHKLAFLNPPFGHIEPWARKCSLTTDLEIFLLVPASVGSQWWLKYVHKPAVADGRVSICFLQPRLSFDDKAPYPKDCALIHYNDPESPTSQYMVWNWMKDVIT